MSRYRLSRFNPLIQGEGVGFPFLLTMLAVGATGANVTGIDQIQPFLAVDTTKRGNLVLAEAQIYIESLGAGATGGNNTYTVNKVDANGNLILQVCQFVVPYTAHSVAAVDLRAANNGAGISVLPGEYLRLDSGTLATGLTTNPSGVIVRISAQHPGVIA